MPSQQNFEPPAYMEVGSTGKAVNPLLRFLQIWSLKNIRPGLEPIVVDGMFGEVGGAWMAEWQTSKGLEPDGGCGPATRAAMITDGFNFVEEAKKTGQPYLSTFKQPDGTPDLFWGPEIEPTESMAGAILKLGLRWDDSA